MNKFTNLKRNKIARSVLFLCAFILFMTNFGFTTPLKGSFNLTQIVKERKVSLNHIEKNILIILNDMQSKTGINFGLSEGINAEEMGLFSVHTDNLTVEAALNQLLSKTNYTYRLVDDAVLVERKAPAANEKVTVTGKVVDEAGAVIAGATVIVVGTTDGAITDDRGQFSVKVEIGQVLEVSYAGMTELKYTVTKAETNLILKMKASTIAVDDVVVTGYFERSKNSFTGSAKTVTGDQIRNISSTNIMNALSILDPSIQIVQNNDQGSNPNAIPELIIRGTSSLNASNEFGVNSPLIVIDGVESTLRALYDIDPNDIESAVILKDASATALYGEQAANGVILVNRKRVSDKALRVSYNFIGKVEFPDLSGYQLMNAREKLDYELYAGVYDDKTGDNYLVYAEKQARVNAGIDTDWISKPLRTSFSHSHNASISGEGSGVYYQLTARYASTNGVMRTDNRTNTGVGVYFQHNLNQKLITTLRADFGQNTTKGSRYGNFQDYVNANPYDAPYDKDGYISPLLSYDLPNPLYEYTLSSFSETKNKELSASLNVRWNVIPGFYLTGFASITNNDNRADQYVSPLSATFKNVTDASLKGSYAVNAGKGNAYYGKFTANFNRGLDQHGSLISINAGGEIRKDNLNPYGFTTYGFFNDKLTDPTFGAGFGVGQKATGESSESATVAFIAAANLSFRNRYFADASYRVSGSSKFGKDKRYAPFWSVGLGWNIHNEKFAKDAKWIDVIRLRGSYGYTGSINFKSYQAITTYRYSSDLIGKYAMGASPITMGNPDLKWQTTKKFNVGLTSTLFKERLDINVDYYRERTVDMIVPVSMPPSSGITTTYNNLGEQTNNGIEFTVSGMVIKRKDLNWRISLNGASNKNTLVKIGEALKRQNEKNATVSGSSPLGMYVEGESSTQLYVVRSAGIDPAFGREIYITKDGRYTFDYNPLDKVAVGDSNPTLRGAVSSYLYYKGFTFNVNLQYSYGGYIYNSTRATRIEQINPKYNADRRAYVERWKQAGDVVNYLTMRPDSKGNITNIHSERFIEKENYLSIAYISFGYEFNSKFLQKIGFKRLNVSASMNEIARFSTVKQERGISYPYARGFSFTISPTF